MMFWKYRKRKVIESTETLEIKPNLGLIYETCRGFGQVKKGKKYKTYPTCKGSGT